MGRFKVAELPRQPRFDGSAPSGPRTSAAPSRFDATEAAGVPPRAEGAPGLARSAWASYLNCPSCGLSIRVKPSHLAIAHCPRCAGRGGRLAPLRAVVDPDARVVAASRRPGSV